jgi:putative PIN family toxin of toxin-antitoxin system
VKIILDTNVVISGIFFAGPPYQILKAWREGKIHLLISEEILTEYRRVGETLALQFPSIDLLPILDMLSANAEVISVKCLPEPVCDDPDDDKFLACALAGECKLIVSGDKHLLKASGFRSIKVLKPREFVNNWGQSKIN